MRYMQSFRLSLQHNDSYAFRNRSPLTAHQRLHQHILPDMSGLPRSSVRRCKTCGALLAKQDEPLTDLKIRKRRYDLSITYDGVLIGSESFKEVYDSSNLVGLRFTALPEDPTLFSVIATTEVRFDSERRGTRFINKCPQCGHYESVVGAIPVYLVDDEGISDRAFVRTDLEFGSNDEKHPLLICGLSAAKALQDRDLKGVELLGI